MEITYLTINNSSKIIWYFYNKQHKDEVLSKPEYSFTNGD
jgi:hypothetical protein